MLIGANTYVRLLCLALVHILPHSLTAILLIDVTMLVTASAGVLQSTRHLFDLLVVVLCTNNAALTCV